MFHESITIGRLMIKYDFDNNWKKWIRSNIELGCDKQQIERILLENNYHPQVIIQELSNIVDSENTSGLIEKYNTQKDQDLIPSSSKKLSQQTDNICSDLNIPLQTSPMASALNNVYLPLAKKLDSDKVNMYVLDDFLSNQECSEVISRIQKACRPSTITTPDLDFSDNEFRTSQTCDLSHNADEFIKDLDRRISDYIGYEKQRSEGIQGQLYHVGNQFKSHTDFFEPNTQEFTQFAGEMGQRTWTFMIYLNDVPEGGQTAFTKLGLIFTPKKGQALMWNSLHHDGEVNRNTEHWAKPIIKGEKYVITKWFRTHGHLRNTFMPFLHKQIPIFTQTGFKKTTLPKGLFQKIKSFYQKNKTNKTNDESREQKTSLDTIALSTSLQSETLQTLNPMLEEWSGQLLDNSVICNIYEYQENDSTEIQLNSYQNQVISAIINIDQDKNCHWPLHIYDHYSRLHKITLKPGDAIFYESARIAQGHPKVLKGKYYASLFVHTVPVNWGDKAKCLNEQLQNRQVRQKTNLS